MLKTRLLTAVVLVVVFLGAVYLLPAPEWWLFCIVILAIAAWEWAALVPLVKSARAGFAAAICAASLLAAAPSFSGSVSVVYGVSALFWIAVVPLWLRSGLGAASPWLVGAAGCLALPPCFVALIQLRALGPETLLLYMAVVWIADSAAYFAGRGFGRHKLAPTISPGKTWEGVAGALLAVAAYGILWTSFIRHGLPGRLATAPVGPYGLLPVLLFLAVLSIYGDLFESAIKRRAGVKDSGTVLPGHGGILDRIDALIPVLPLSGLLFLI